jgi:hypothetical protein
VDMDDGAIVIVDAEIAESVSGGVSRSGFGPNLAGFMDSFQAFLLETFERVPLASGTFGGVQNEPNAVCRQAKS